MQLKKGSAKSGEPVPTPFDDGELYDLVCADLDFDRGSYLALAQESPGPVLEVGCGTGRVLLPCLRAGVEIEGLDLYAPMLETLRKKAARLGLAPVLYRADMRGFRVPRKYALIIIPFNGFAHSLTTEDQLLTLGACRDHLLPEGTLVFNVGLPGPEWLCGPEGEPVLEGEVRHPKTGLPVRMYDTRYFNWIDQVQTSHNEIQELDEDGRVVASHPSRTEVRWTCKPEMELLLRVAGFSRWQICGGFDRSPLERESGQMVVFAWK